MEAPAKNLNRGQYRAYHFPAIEPVPLQLPHGLRSLVGATEDNMRLPPHSLGAQSHHVEDVAKVAESLREVSAHVLLSELGRGKVRNVESLVRLERRLHQCLGGDYCLGSSHCGL